MLLAGILFANLLLMFGLALPAVLDHYQSVLKDNLLSNYQYILQIPAETMDEDKKLESLVQMMYVQSQLETDNDDAEKFSAYSLNTLGDQYKSEEVLLYGNSAGQPLHSDSGRRNIKWKCIYFLRLRGQVSAEKRRYDHLKRKIRRRSVYLYGQWNL